EIVERALGLSAPESVSRNLQWPEGVAFDAGPGRFFTHFGHEICPTPPRPEGSDQATPRDVRNKLGRRRGRRSTIISCESDQVEPLHRRPRPASPISRACPPAQAEPVFQFRLRQL